MNWRRLVFQTHRWLAAAAFVPVLIWFFSGVVILLPGHWFGALTVVSEPPPPEPRYEDVRVSLPQAIAAASEHVGAQLRVTSVGFSRIEGRLLYQIRVRGRIEPLLVDAITGEPYVLDAQKARELLGRVVDVPFGPDVQLVRRHDGLYAYGPLPAYRFDAADAWKTSYFVVVENAEIRRATLSGRVFQFLVGTHRFRFLVPWLGQPAVHVVMLVFSVVATVMSVFGVAILWIQFANWRARRQGAAVARLDESAH